MCLLVFHSCLSEAFLLRTVVICSIATANCCLGPVGHPCDPGKSPPLPQVTAKVTANTHEPETPIYNCLINGRTLPMHHLCTHRTNLLGVRLTL